MKELNIDPEWFLQMVEKEGNGIISVGGFFTSESMNTEERYSVPLTLPEIKALLNSHCHHTGLRQHHSSAIAQLEDVWYNCCELEVIKQQNKSNEIIYHVVGNIIWAKDRNRQQELSKGRSSDIFVTFGYLLNFRFKLGVKTENIAYAVACVLPITDDSTSVNPSDRIDSGNK